MQWHADLRHEADLRRHHDLQQRPGLRSPDHAGLPIVRRHEHLRRRGHLPGDVYLPRNRIVRWDQHLRGGLDLPRDTEL